MTGYEQLERNLTDMVLEEQAKLGYMKEKIRFYYPLTTLNHFFGGQDTAPEMMTRLEQMPQQIPGPLGKTGVTRKGDRFCLEVTEEGNDYVHGTKDGSRFIEELIRLVSKHGCTMEQVIALFRSHSEQVEISPATHGEFDLAIRFLDDPLDPYYYCLKDEGAHITYHRYLPADYRDFGFDE